VAKTPKRVENGGDGRRNWECGLRPVGAIRGLPSGLEAYGLEAAPEGKRNKKEMGRRGDWVTRGW